MHLLKKYNLQFCFRVNIPLELTIAQPNAMLHW